MVVRLGIQPGYVILVGVAVLAAVAIASQSNRDAVTASISPPRVEVKTNGGLPPGETSALTLVGKASVIDGDTVDIHGTRVRFNGIDAPESQQTCEASGSTYRCGQAAANALSNLISSGTISCARTGTDRYGRTIAKCFLDGADLSSWMVINGWAVAYRKYSLDYVADQERAKSRKVGIWAGSFMPPEEWRKAKRGQ